MKRIAYYFSYLVLLTLVACGGSGTPVTNTPLTNSGEVLANGTYVNADKSWAYQNLRLPNQTGGYAYAQYFQANGAGAHPVVVVTQPYTGIDWTGEAVDTRWADQYRTHLTDGGGLSMCVPDVDGPDFNAASSSTICYTPLSAEQIGDSVSIYLLNNVSVLVAYGRFYAGGTVANDIEDMVAGLRFLGTRSEIDSTQIGITGNSWGGFEALYAALNAPANVRPAVAVPVYPISDFAGLASNFIEQDLPNLVSAPVLAQYNAFYDPFLRRFFATTGQPPTTDYSGFTLNDLVVLVDMPILIPHDDGDTILPAQFSHDFAAANPALIEGFWYKRSDTAPWETVVTQHGQITNAILQPAYQTFATTYLLNKLNNAGQDLYITYGEQDMQEFFNNIRTYQLETRDISWLVPRLIEMCETSIFMVELTPGNATPISTGADYVAQSLNDVWGTTLTATMVQQYLRDNGLPN